MTVQDELLQARLERNRQEAYAACAQMLGKSGVPAVLVDVEHLFDGQGLFFYFLGDVTPELEAYTDRLADTYEAKVQFRKFTETLIEGCGPGCGTEEAKGNGGCESCTSCAVAAPAARGVNCRGEQFAPSDAKNSLISRAACASSCWVAAAIPLLRTARASSFRPNRASC